MSDDNIEATDAEVDAIGEILYAAGWRDKADALGDGLRAAIPKLRAALSKHVAAPVPAAPKDCPVTVRELLDSGMRPVPNGWALVPKEPTEAMVVAALKEVDPLRELIDWQDAHGFTREDARRAWAAMLAAAQEQSGGAE